MKLFFRCLGILLIASAHSSIAMEMYTYTLYLRTSLDNCKEWEKVVPDRFAKNLDVKKVRTFCEEEGYRSYNLKTQYLAEDPVSLNRDTEIFSTLGECNDKLEDRKMIFQNLTGLQPFVAFCTAPGGMIHGNLARMYIDGFGAAKLRPFQYENDFLGSQPKVYIDNLWKIISDVLTAKEGSAVRVKIYDIDPVVSKGISYLFSVNYYAKAAFSLRVSTNFSFDSVRSCEQNLPKVLQAFKSAPIVTAFCGSWLQRGKVNLLWETSKGPFCYHDEADPEIFTSLQNCEDSKDRILKIHEEVLGKKVFGGVCAQQFNWGECKGYGLQVLSLCKEN